MLVDAAQGGVNQHIRLTMQPARPSLADCLRVLELLENPAAAKIDGTSAHRRVLTTEPEHGLVSIMGPGGNFYANTVGTFGFVSDGHNWDRLASAANRWDLKLVGGEKSIYYSFRTTQFFPPKKRSLMEFSYNDIFY